MVQGPVERRCRVLAALGAIGVAVACGGGREERFAFGSLLETERDFGRAAEAYGMKVAFLRYLDDESILFRPDPVKGRPYIQLQPDPGIKLSWEPTRAAVARSGDLGYTTGPYRVEPDQPGGVPLLGYFVTIWRRQSNGRWKALLDVGTENPRDQPCTETPDLAWHESSAAPPAADVPSLREALLHHERELAAGSGAGRTAAVYGAALLDDGRVYRDGHCPAVGKAAALDLLSRQAGVLDWQPIDGGVARGTDLAYTYGRYELAGPGGDGTPLERGYYVRVWRRAADGGWRLAVDVTNPVPEGSTAATSAAAPPTAEQP